MRRFLAALLFLFALTANAQQLGLVTDFNINPTSDSTQQQQDNARKAGFVIERYTLYWNRFSNPAPGVYDFSQVDREVARITASGQRIYMNLFSAPAHASGGKPAYEEGIHGCWLLTANGGVKYNDTLDYCTAPPHIDRQAFVAFVEQVVLRYRDKIDYYGFWNEPNYDLFWPPRYKGGDPEFSRLINEILIPAYDTVKRLDPTAKVVGAEMDDIGSLEEIMQAEKRAGRPLWDVISFHAYSWGRPYPEHAIERLRDGFLPIAKKYSNGRPLWITETAPMDEGDPVEASRKAVQFVEWVRSTGDVEYIFFYRIGAPYAAPGLPLSQYIKQRRRPVKPGPDYSPRVPQESHR